MRNKRIGLVTALLCVSLSALSGCSGSATIYTAGLSEETAAAGADGLETETDSDSDAESAVGMQENPDKSADASVLSDTLAGLNVSVEADSETEAIVGYVYVCGAVNEPGVYPIREDMRVCDAVGLAGGFTDEADDEWLNQAAVLCDGQKLYIYTVEETDLMRESGMVPEGMTGSTSDTGGSGGLQGTSGADGSEGTSSLAETADTGTASDGKVNINTATREELMTLPGIGESKADAIVSYRNEYGAFASIEEIQNISGIKSGVFSQIKDLITV